MKAMPSRKVFVVAGLPRRLFSSTAVGVAQSRRFASLSGAAPGFPQGYPQTVDNGVAPGSRRGPDRQP